MEDDDARRGAGLLQARDGLADLVLARIATAGHDHRYRAGVLLALHLGWVEGALRTALEHLIQVAIYQRHDGLRLWIAEAGVELDDPGPPVGQHETRKEAADERMAVSRHALDGGLEDLLVDLLHQLGGHEGRRREGPHAARVRALVVVEDPLVVLRRRQHREGLAVAACEDRALHTRHQLLQDDLLAGLPHGALLQEVTHRLLRLLPARRHDDTLARSQATGLDDHHEGRLVHVFQRGL
mmetsp:Transcript_1456/g.3696  ORF Transcript_1456/g.3696 Transcript_1456/m.3696 type:complete len:240 (+) Transcript_1456:417-1136(+)